MNRFLLIAVLAGLGQSDASAQPARSPRALGSVQLTAGARVLASKSSGRAASKSRSTSIPKPAGTKPARARSSVVSAPTKAPAPTKGQTATAPAAKRPAPAAKRGAPAAVVAKTPVKPTSAKPLAPQHGKRIVILDAGHGGDRGGMRARLPNGSYIDEKTITLGVARKLRDELLKRGVEVVMTRERDGNVCPGTSEDCPIEAELAERGRIANDAHGDLFLSIHVNAAGPAEKNPKGVRGLETYFLAEAKTEDERRVESMENEVVRFETAAPIAADNPLAFIINDMAQNEHLRESSELASTILAGVGATHPGPSRGVKQANFSVLRHAFMPAVLVETGFGSNPTEAQWLSSDAGQRQLAMAIADATMDYLVKYERRVRASAER